jgi:copper oxidase (laccase) domain-containing protein
MATSAQDSKSSGCDLADANMSNITKCAKWTSLYADCLPILVDAKQCLLVIECY